MITKDNAPNLIGSSFCLDEPGYEDVTFVLNEVSPNPKVKKLVGRHYDYHKSFAQWSAQQVIAPRLEQNFRCVYEEPFDVSWEFLSKAKLN